MENRLEEISICPMSETDLDEVLSIEADSFPRPWIRNHFLDELNSPHAFPLVAFGPDNRVIGYICPMLVIDEGHILDVAVDKVFRGKGVGRMLVERALQDCRANGAEFVSLEVRISNQSAIRLYENVGFIKTGRRKAYYENGEDALLMEYIFESGEVGRNAV